MNNYNFSKYFYPDTSFWLEEYTDSFKENFNSAAALIEEQTVVAETVSDFLSQSCTDEAKCHSIELPKYIPDLNLSDEENLEKSVEQAMNEPLRIEGLQVSTPAEIDNRLSEMFDDTSEASDGQQPKSALNDFASIPKNQLNQVLGDSMVSSVNGFFVEIDACMSVGSNTIMRKYAPSLLRAMCCRSILLPSFSGEKCFQSKGYCTFCHKYNWSIATGGQESRTNFII